MIEPPKLFTDARKEYDLQDVEVLGKITLELGLQMKAEIRAAFEKLVDLTGTHQFQREYIVLHEYIMNKREEILASVIYTGCTLPTMVSAEQLKKTLAISCLAPKRFPVGGVVGVSGNNGGNVNRYHQYGPLQYRASQGQIATASNTANASSTTAVPSVSNSINGASGISQTQKGGMAAAMHLQPTLRTSPPSSINTGGPRKTSLMHHHMQLQSMVSQQQQQQQQQSSSLNSMMSSQSIATSGGFSRRYTAPTMVMGNNNNNSVGNQHNNNNHQHQHQNHQNHHQHHHNQHNNNQNMQIQHHHNPSANFTQSCSSPDGVNSFHHSPTASNSTAGANNGNNALISSQQQQQLIQGPHSGGMIGNGSTMVNNNSSAAPPLRSWHFRNIRRSALSSSANTEDSFMISSMQQQQQHQHQQSGHLMVPQNGSSSSKSPISRSGSFASSVQANQVVDVELNLSPQSAATASSGEDQSACGAAFKQGKDISDYRTPLPFNRSTTMPVRQPAQLLVNLVDDVSSCDNRDFSNTDKRQMILKQQQDLIDQWMHFE